MAIKVIDLINDKNPPFHLILDDGKSTIGLDVLPNPDALGRSPVSASSLKTTTGNQSYSDLRPPYMVIAQDDFSGGRGNNEFEKDTTRYYDSSGLNTERNTEVILGPREGYGTGIIDDVRNIPGSMHYISLAGGRQYMAVRKATTAAMPATTKIWLWVRKVGTPTEDLTVNLRSDSAGDISTVLQTATLAESDTPNLLGEIQLLSITSTSLAAATAYWIEVYAGSDDTDKNHWEIGVLENAGSTSKSADGITYTSDTVDLYYRLTQDDTDSGGYLFTYQSGFYFMTKPIDGTASRLYLSGARGLATSNAGNLDKVICSTSHGLTAAEAIGSVVVIVGGTGSEEEKNYRLITGVPTVAQFSVDEPWLVVHDNTTEWVTVGTNKWKEISVSANISVAVTDVHISTFGYVYFCQGESDVIVRMKEEASGGSWVRTLADDGANKAVFLDEYNNVGQKMTRTNGDGKISECAVVTSWTDLITWTTGIQVGDKYDRITGIRPYKDYALADAMVVFKESGPWLYKDETVDVMRTPEMGPVASYKNGRAHAAQGSYLFFSVQNTVWRFFNPDFSDIGMTADEGLPTDRQGPVTGFLAYPGRLYASIDAGPNGYSTIMVTTGGPNWHEIYRAPKGERIYTIGHVVVPGNGMDKMWIRQGADLVYLPFPSETYNPAQDTYYQFRGEGYLELSSITAGIYDAWKYWESLKLRTRNLIEDTTWLDVDYRGSEDDDWQQLPYDFTESPVESQPFDADYGLSGQILYLRVRFYSRDVYETPKLVAVAISGVTVTQPKYAFELTARIGTSDMNNKPIIDKPHTRVRKLDEWCGTARPLIMWSTDPLYNGKKVFLMPIPSRPLQSAHKVDEHSYMVTIALQEA